MDSKDKKKRIVEDVEGDGCNNEDGLGIRSRQENGYESDLKDIKSSRSSLSRTTKAPIALQ
jgi:hypothetical protein